MISDGGEGNPGASKVVTENGRGQGSHDAALAVALAPEFEILRPIGQGSTANVYLARETELRRLVAIKVPLPILARDPVVRARFEREARAAARLRHPGIGAIHRIARLPDETPYLVMEYLEGSTLDDILQAEGSLPPTHALRLLRQVADALAEAHRHGVIHRDLRPGNVFRVADGDRAVLTDFGLAGILETGAEVVTRLTQPGEVLGDDAYRSPEQLLGEPLSPAADIYAWGLLAFETLTLQRPFDDSGRSIGNAHLRRPPRNLRDLDPDADPRLARIIAACLAKDPRHRPSARALVRSLARLRKRRAARRDAARFADAGPGPTSGAISTAAENLPGLAGFLAELRRRRVFNVAIGYAALAYVLLQGAGLILPALPLPPWAYPLVVAITLAGFPVAMVLTWMYDLTNAGIQRAEAAPPAAGPLRWVLPSIGLLLSLILAGIIGWWVLG